MSKLYQSKDGKHYGTLLAVNSSGKYVLELKGAAGGVQAFDPSEVEVVIPYTVELHNPEYGRRAMQAPKDLLTVNDLLSFENRIWTVTKIDTKAEGSAELPKSTRLVKSDLIWKEEAPASAKAD